MIESIEIHLQTKQSCSIETLCKQQDKLAFKHIKQCIDNGAVWLTKNAHTKRIFDPEAIIDAGQSIHIYCNEYTLKPAPFKATLVQDFDNFSVWYKPAGMLSQGSKFGSHWSIHRWIEQHEMPERHCFITHRLDRFTQGLMIVAHNKDINFKLHRLFEKRNIKKTYRAIVRGLFPVGEIVEINSQINKQDASSTVEGLEQDVSKNISLLKIAPLTGRKHQVRRHLSYMGHSILNDRQYGETPYTGDLKLQAATLEFIHPETQQLLTFTIPNPQLLTLENS